MAAFIDGKTIVKREEETNLPWMEVKRNQCNFQQTLTSSGGLVWQIIVPSKSESGPAHRLTKCTGTTC